uniref:Unnamed protein product n=1 Tax=Phytophthora lilii TaxID=2077276 RepID=A0A9W6WQH4_9STRA|nr:unnamed protein product [Phytophthora lilii]
MPPKLSTPAIAEVVHTPEPSVIKPVESSNVKVSEVPNVDESIVAPVIADSVQGSTTLVHYYCKNKQMMTNIPIMIDELNVAQYCVANELYDQRLYKLCCMIKRSWFRDNNNTWNLAGALYRKQHLSESQIKSFARGHNPEERGHNPEEHNKWKAKYESTLVPKAKTRITSDNVAFTDNCLLRIEKIGRLNSVEKDFLLDGINKVDAMLEGDWLDEYVTITNRPILGYKRTWQEYIRYVQAIRFS